MYIFEEMFTLVPAETDEKTVNQINHILLDPGNERKYYSNKTQSGVNVNFAIHHELATQVEKAFSKVEWIHPIAVLLNQPPETDQPNLSLLIRTQNHYFLIIRQRTRLI